MSDSIVKKPLGQKMIDGISHFLGIGDLDEGTKNRYRKRRENCYRTKLKCEDEVDACPCPGRKQCEPKSRESLYSIVKKKVAAEDTHRQIDLEERTRSFRPADLSKRFEGTVPFSQLKAELFYDEVPDATERGEDGEGRVSSPGAQGEDQLDMGMVQPSDLPETDNQNGMGSVSPEGARGESQMDMGMTRPSDLELDDHDELDVGPDIPLTRITGKKEIPRRMVSEKPRMTRMDGDLVRGITRAAVGKKERKAVVDQLCDSATDFFCCTCRVCKWKKSEKSNDKRPYFSYFITFVQIVIMITAVSVYGFAKPHHSQVTEEELVMKPSLSIQLVRKSEFGNIWLGPRQADLIHLGAKYSPCMRKDPNLHQVLELDRMEEEKSGCCVRDDGAGCVQTVDSHCSNLISTFVKYNKTHQGNQNITAGAVCGQDPKYCKKPSSKAPFEWNKNDITKWPICEDTSKPVHSGIVGQPDRHMTCQLLGHPCCHGIQGECMITTREHCEFLRGYYHEEAFLCSQVNCFGEVCGMIPFVYEDRPDQFSRVVSANLLHAGFLHMAISFFFQVIVMARVEQIYGSLRILFIYSGSGIIGTLASCVLLPYHVETGPAGAHFGILACIYVDLLYNILYNYQNGRKWMNGDLWFNFGIYSLVLFVLFLLGLLPWLDNWAHIFGFLSGLLLSLVLIKEVQFEEKGLTKLRVIIVSLLLFVAMFVLLMIGFYVVPITEGSWVQYLNCIPFDETFCHNMDVSITRGATYSKYL